MPWRVPPYVPLNGAAPSARRDVGGRGAAAGARPRGASVKWPKPVSVVLALVLLVSVAAAVLYASGGLPYRLYVVHTGSMSPKIPPESAVVVREGRFRVGDVISFTEHGTVVTHRLISINSDGTITTKGDANRTADPWRVPVADIVGRVVAVPHRLGYLLMYLRTPQGCASFVVALLCLWQIWALAAGLSPREWDGVALNA
jgi:signal peptidase I